MRTPTISLQTEGENRPVASTSTETRTAVPTPTISLQIGDESLLVKQVVFREEFANAKNGWKVEDGENYSLLVADGEYQMRMGKAANGTATSASSSVKFSGPPITGDFALLLDARAIRGPRYNLYGFLYGDGNTQVYYQIYLTDNGYFTISYFGADASGAKAWQKLFPQWQEARPLKAQGNWNKLALVRRGSMVTLFVNDQKLHSFDDSHKVGLETLGLHAGAPEEGVAIVFDNIYLATLR